MGCPLEEQGLATPEDRHLACGCMGARQNFSKTCLQVICMPRQLHALASPAQPGFDQQREANTQPLPQKAAYQ